MNLFSFLNAGLMQKPSGKDPALYRKHRTGSVRFFYVVFNFHIRLYKGLVNTLLQLKAGIQEQIINHTFLLTYQYMISFMMPLEYMKDIMENFQVKFTFIALIWTWKRIE